MTSTTPEISQTTIPSHQHIYETTTPVDDKNIPYHLSSITPSKGSIMGSFVLSVRGRSFVERGIKCMFRGTTNNQQLEVQATKVTFVSRSLLEVVVPSLECFRGSNSGPMMVRVLVACGGRGYCKETRVGLFRSLNPSTAAIDTY